MPKMKTKSAAKKRFKVSAKGKVVAKPAAMRHMQMNKPKSMKRAARATMTLFKADGENILQYFLPYSRKKARKPSVRKVEGAE